MAQELKKEIEALVRMRLELDIAHKSESEKIDAQLETIKMSMQEISSLLEVDITPRITLQQRLAGCFSPVVGWVKRNSTTLFWFILYLVAIPVFFCVGYFLPQLGSLQPNPDRDTPPALLTMTHTEHDLLRSAGKLVNRDIDKYESVGDALSAFYAESGDSATTVVS